MHELSIAISLVDVATEEAQKLGATSVLAVYLKLGPLAGVVQDALLFSYKVATAGTLLQGSRLIIEESPIEVFCTKCRERRPVQSIQDIRCAVCHEPGFGILQGKEIEVVGLEIDS
jgi:hydrogenase nickel incorporation protein HypA/HybF